MTLGLRDFLRPIGLACLCFVAAVAVVEFLGLLSPHRALRAPVPWVAQLEQPRPELSPEEVVRIQLRSLASANGMGMVECFGFASPANRVQTGPIERFAQMVRQPPYDVLSQPHTSVVGSAVFREETARVLVTILHSQRVSTFVWVLSRQKDPPFAGCWMSDAVLPVARLRGAEPQDSKPAGDSPVSPTI